jgi:RNA polymerase primary sigma factor
VDKGRTIRMLAHMAEKIRNVSRAFNELSIERGREPTEEKVAERLGWSAEDIRLVIEAMPGVTSSTAYRRGGDVTHRGLRRGRADFGHTSEVLRSIETPHLEKVIECLSAGARYVLARRYGLDGADPATLVEFSRELAHPGSGPRSAAEYRAP